MRLLSAFNNFSRAGLDHDLMGRYDLPIYASGADVFKNGISNFKGNAIYRAGFESMQVFQDCAFAEFKFNNQQQYLIVMYANKFRFMSYDVNGDFGWVLDSSGINPLEVSTPYSLEDCKLLDYTQKNDTMVFTRKGFAPRKLIRLSANSFSFSVYARTADPFVNLEASKVITAITQANPAVVTIAAHGYVTGDKVFITGVVGMEQVNDIVFDVTFIGANTFSIGVDSTAYDAYVSDGTGQKLKSTAITGITQANPAVVTSAAHTLSSGDIVKIYNINGMTQVNGNTYTVDKINANSFSLRGIDSTGYTAFSASANGRVRELEDYPAKCRYYKGRLYFANTSLRITTIFASKSGDYDNFTLTPVDDASALQFTIADISQEIEWLFGGDNSLIVGAGDGIVAVNGGSVGSPITAGTVASKPTSAPPCNGAMPLSKDGMIFYVGLDGRNIYYFQYDLLTESFIAEDANFVSYDITKSGMNKIRWKKDRNDLITAIANDGRLLTNNFNAKEKIIGWHEHEATEAEFLDEAVITDQEGRPQLFALVKRGSAYYIERQAAYVEFSKRTKFVSEYDDTDDLADVKEFDEEAFKAMVAQEMKDCIFVDGASTVNNLQSNPIQFVATGGSVGEETGYIIATNSVFTADHVGRHIAYKTETGYERGRFEILEYVSGTRVNVQVLQETTQNFYTDWYLTFSTISGLDQYNGTEIACVADGAYIGDYFVSGGTIDLERQVTSAVVGYKYMMMIKSFCLGIPARADNTQTTMKTVASFGVRCVTTAGLKVGTSPYKLEDVQNATSDDTNFLPPFPIDGTKYVTVTDSAEKDKFFYIIQDKPLPAVVTAVMLNADHTLTQ